MSAISSGASSSSSSSSSSSTMDRHYNRFTSDLAGGAGKFLDGQSLARLSCANLLWNKGIRAVAPLCNLVTKHAALTHPFSTILRGHTGSVLHLTPLPH